MSRVYATIHTKCRGLTLNPKLYTLHPIGASVFGEVEVQGFSGSEISGVKTCRVKALNFRTLGSCDGDLEVLGASLGLLSRNLNSVTIMGIYNNS